MPDSPPAPASGASRIAGLVLAVAGAVGLVAAVFVTWYRVTAPLPDVARLGGLPSEIEARINGIGTVTMPAYDNLDVSSSVPNDVAWGGWAAIAIAVAAVVAASAAAFGPATWRAVGAWGALACGVLGAALGLYAQLVPVGSQPVSVGGFTLQVDTAASVGPPVVWIAALPLLLGAVLLDRARRSAPATVGQPAQAPQLPASPYGPAAQVPRGPIPGAPRPGAPAPAAPPAPQHAAPAPSNQRFPQADPGWARPVAPPQAPPPLPDPVPDAQARTAVAPVAQRRPQPEWDRNWPGAVPPKPGPPTPSEQHTQVVKRPPRPVRVSPKPETDALPRRDPRFDSPTQP
ncbi:MULTISPECIES: hypothetical protein [Tsukamurella]|uniref:Uncharacterized protein n=2 Tax=Tsukamurella TaxID=2060 RepID=A0A5C5S3Q4_9ACTN|nr:MULTISPECIES: hypothetical protein [Tsukamurella]NMD55003.1 hypothetical protein [Tsukamurella columbiensis]TWS30037.1 hypothetical protein FK530_05830 [Tsukamurella conjunctivitidis]